LRKFESPTVRGPRLLPSSHEHCRRSRLGGDVLAAAIVTHDPNRIAAYQAPEWVIVTQNSVTSGETVLGVVRPCV